MEKQIPQEDQLLQRITVDPKIFGGKPIIRGHRLAVAHVLGMLAAEDIQACLVYARRLVGPERVDPALGGSEA